MTNINFIISSNPTTLSAAIAGHASATVEAEYGETCVEGSVLTLAHHGPRAGNPAPCMASNGCAEGVEIVGLSHLDLDSLGGCAAILGRKPEAPSFWRLASFVDVNGVHKLGQAEASAEDIRRLHAYYAWSEDRKVYAPRDGSVLDVTKEVTESVETLEKILVGDEDLLVAGDKFKARGESLNASSFVEAEKGVIARVHEAFTNHLYASPEGEAYEAVVSYGTTHGSITVSFADTPKGKSAREIVQSLWGELAGGHAGIAGSPRGRRMSLADFVDAVEATRATLRDC